jgi:predicted RNase H-like HicB family nuclease
MQYLIKLLKSEEGHAVWCPTLLGCCSQGETEAEALDNIKSAIQEYLAVVEELSYRSGPNPVNRREFPLHP